MKSTVRLAVLISGGGRTLKNLIDRIAAGTLDAKIAVVASSSREARGRAFATDSGIPLVDVPRSGYPGREAFGRAMWSALAPHSFDLVVLAGFLCFLPIPPAWRDRVLNIHPALLPKFGGRGMYGHHVHEAVLATGEIESGCTVHVVDEVYDHGRIVLQRRVPVLPNDSPDTLAARVFEAECAAYPEAIQRFAQEIQA